MFECEEMASDDNVTNRLRRRRMLSVKKMYHQLEERHSTARDLQMRDLQMDVSIDFPTFLSSRMANHSEERACSSRGKAR